MLRKSHHWIKKTKCKLGFGTVLLTAFAVMGASSISGPKVIIDYRYEEAATSKLVNGVAELALPAAEFGSPRLSTDPGIEKTIFLVKVGKTLQQSLKDFEEACSNEPYHPPVMPPPPMPTAQVTAPRPPMPHPQPTPVPCRPGDPRCWHPPVVNRCQPRATEIGRNLSAMVEKLADELLALETRYPTIQDAKVNELLDLGQKLSVNISKGIVYRPTPVPPRPYPMPGPGPAPRPAPQPMPGPAPNPRGGLVVTAGGAKDMAYIRKVILDGGVPAEENLAMEGLLSEFALPLMNAAECRELICIQPAAMVDMNQKKLFIQIAMNSAVTEESFHRKPLNLGLVIDISGSMGANDLTEKSRLEWAKDAAIRTINKLSEEDLLSIVIFDTESELLLRPTPVADKARLIELVSKLGTRGSTNLESGLRLGFEQVSAGLNRARENRVILITDAGLNTGVTDESSLVRLVGDFANEGIGLTAIGIGENFNEEFVRAITLSEGGNYIFAQSGAKIAESFQAFDFLVSPVAFNFKAQLELQNVAARLAHAYGVPAKDDQPVQELINIRTLFFAGSGGGALLLEYDL